MGTMPDIGFVINYLAQLLAGPQKYHWTALKHLLRYLSSTREEGIFFKNNDVNGSLEVFCDENWGGKGYRLTHWYIFFLFECPIG